MQFPDIYRAIERAHILVACENGVSFYKLPLFENTGLVNHGISARMGGVSTGGNASLNMSFSRPDDTRENVMENHRRFAKAASIKWESMVMDTFEHGITVRRVDKNHAGMGYLKPSLPFCDGLITNDPGVALVTGHADCLPLYFLDTEKNAIGLAHAGWKGTFENIAREMVRAMGRHYGCNAADILAGVGPCICENCFEVSEDLRNRFGEAYPGIPCTKPGKPGKGYVDLKMVTVAQFLQEGVLPEHIALMDVCTYEDERLYSHRRDKGLTGGMSAYMQLIGDAGH